MKSQAYVLHQVAVGILTDAQLAYPGAKGIAKDILRLSQLVKDRGLGTFVLDLPSLDSLLLQGLENGKARACGPLTRRTSKRDQRPRFLWDFWSRIFDRELCLLDNPDVGSIAFLRQLCCLGKRLEISCTPERVKAVLNEYYAIEKALPAPTLCWDEDVLYDGNDNRLGFGSYCRSHGGPDELFELIKPTLSSSDIQRLDRVFSSLATSIRVPSLWDGDSGEIWFKHGPGAVSDQTGSEYKYSFPNWPAKLAGEFPLDWCGSAYADQQQFNRVSEHEPPSRLIAVPKTAKGPRLIAAEPVAHQWCQQYVLHGLRQAIDSSWIGDFIDLSRQDLSGALVLANSHSRSLATIDLSSASDRLSCRLVERSFGTNPPLLRLFHATRTRWVRDDISQPTNFLKLKKFAAMGSALTFPVQCLVFLGIALSAMDWDGTQKDLQRLKGRVRIYGDDIIIPVEGYDSMIRLLTLLDLKANSEKSFSLGYFRESCGVDAYAGVDVTPVKPKRVMATDPSGVQSCLDSVNNLFVRGYWHASEALLRTSGVRKFTPSFPVVGPLDGQSGLISFSGRTSHHLKRRWNSTLQRYEMRRFALVAKSPRKEVQNWASLLEHASRAFSYLSPRELGVRGRVRTTLRCIWEVPCSA